MKAINPWTKEPTMSARELLEALKNIPETNLDLPVMTEGCDCDGSVRWVTLDLEVGRVYIERPKE
jgi:hypothetical protein